MIISENFRQFSDQCKSLREDKIIRKENFVNQKLAKNQHKFILFLQNFFTAENFLNLVQRFGFCFKDHKVGEHDS